MSPWFCPSALLGETETRVPEWGARPGCWHSPRSSARLLRMERVEGTQALWAAQEARLPGLLTPCPSRGDSPASRGCATVTWGRIVLRGNGSPQSLPVVVLRPPCGVGSSAVAPELRSGQGFGRPWSPSSWNSCEVERVTCSRVLWLREGPVGDLAGWLRWRTTARESMAECCGFPQGLRSRGRCGPGHRLPPRVCRAQLRPAPHPRGLHPSSRQVGMLGCGGLGAWTAPETRAELALLAGRHVPTTQAQS